MNLFTLFAKIVLQDDGIANKLKSIENQGKSTGNIVENSFEKIKSGALKVAGILGIGLGFKAATEGAYKMAESASDLNEAQNVVEQTFGKTAKSIEQWTTTTEKSAGISQTASMQWAGFMGAMLKSSGVSQTSSASMSKNLVQLTGDMSSFYNVSTSDMWEKIRSGISGETEPLKQIGINMSVANLQAYALAEGIKKPYAQMSQGEQTTLRYNYLMSVTKDAQGDFGKTLSGSFANQVRVAQMNLADLGRNIGTVLLPYFMKGASWLNSNMPAIQKTVTSVVNSIINVAKNLAPTFSTWIKLITQIASSLLPSFGNSAKGASSAVKDLANGALKTVSSVLYTMRDHINAVKVVLATLTTVWGLHKTAVLASNVASTAHNVVAGISAIKDKAETGYLIGLTVAEKARAVATKASAVAQGALNVVMSANPIALVVIAITALVAGFVLLYNKSTTFRNFVNTLWNTLKQFASSVKADVMAVIQIVVAKFEEFKVHITSIFNEVSAFFTSVWNTISNVFNTVINAIVTFVNTTFGSMITDIKIIFTDLQAMFGAVWDAIKNIFLGAVLLLLDLVTGNFNKLKSDAQAIWNNIKEDFQAVWEAIKIIFVTALDLVKDTVTTAWNGIKSITESLWNGLKAFLEGLWNTIKSLASTAWNGLKDAVLAIVHSVVDTAKSIWNGLLSWFESLPSRLYNAGSSMFNSLKSGISSVLGTITSVVQSGFNGAINFITSLPSKAVKWGSDFIDGLVNGIKGAVGKVTDAVSGVADKIRSFLHFSVPDEGSLTDYESWMPDFMNGLASGISNNKYKVIDQVKSLTNGMKINAKATVQGANNSNSTTAKVETKQPITLQLIFDNSEAFAEWLIPDINQLQGKIQLNNSRLNYGRR